MKQLNETDSTDYMAAAGCFCLASRQAARKITRLYDLYMQEAGIRVTQFTILSQLMLRGELPIGKLAGILGMERTTLTRNLDAARGAKVDFDQGGRRSARPHDRHYRAGAECGAPQLSLLVEGAGRISASCSALTGRPR